MSATRSGSLYLLSTRAKKREKNKKLVKTLQVKTGTALVYIGQAKTCDGNYAAVHLQVRQEPKWIAKQ